MPDRRFAEGYARFRGSQIFLWMLCAFLAAWFGCNLLPWLPHFDRPGYGVLNVILSAEASLSVALLMAAAERQDEIQRRQLAYMLHVMEAIHGQMVGAVDAGPRDRESPLVAKSGQGERC